MYPNTERTGRHGTSDLAGRKVSAETFDSKVRSASTPTFPPSWNCVRNRSVWNWDCMLASSQVHLVALGGVDPYGAGVYESSGITASTTPIIVDRIAWAACTQRVNSDIGNPDAAVIFRGIPLADQKLASPDGPEVHSAITQLVQRTYLRNPYRPEVDRYVRLAKDIEAAGTATPAKDWMQSVCFAVLSSAESVFLLREPRCRYAQMADYLVEKHSLRWDFLAAGSTSLAPF